MTKRALPQPNSDQVAFNRVVKEILETIMGQRTGRIRPLSSSASNEDIIAKINEIIERLQ